MSSPERVSVQIDGHVAVATLARPEKHNALDLEMIEQIIAAGENLRRAHGVRAVVLHGAGKSFCSGLDFPAVAAARGLDAFTATLAEQPPNFFQRAAYVWMALPMPVIAAIHGNCFGAGLQIALAADIRIAAPDARLSVMEGRWGLIPDMTVTRTLPRLVGIDAAKELTYTARTVEGREADSLGLVTRTAPEPLAEALELAAEIAAHSPDAVRRAKRLYDAAWIAPEDESLALEAELQSELIGSPNQLAAVAAQLAKTDASFED